jgi:general L-amino acid transport system permease protein
MTATFPPSSGSAPPIAQVGAIAWIRQNLFNSWFNTILTLVIGFILGRGIINFVYWALTTAQWKVVKDNFPLYFVGRYPASQYWRMWAIVWMVCLLAGLSWGILARNAPQLFNKSVLIGAGIVALLLIIEPIPMMYKMMAIAAEILVLAGAWLGRIAGQAKPQLGKWLSLAWGLSFFISLWLMRGGFVFISLGFMRVRFGLEEVNPTTWGGFMMTVLLSVVSIALSFPFGLLLALGRQSDLPVVRWLSTLYIEVIRGVPLISLLFIGSVMVPLFLPRNIPSPDLVVRAIIGLSLFTAAYLAETIRGGLQSIPKGQSEASSALGLNTPLTLALIVLPQALKISIPAIVGLFIALLQDTTLVSIVGLFDLLGISRTILANSDFVGLYAEAYIFIGVLFWVCCYAMSWGSRRLEEQLNTSR